MVTDKDLAWLRKEIEKNEIRPATIGWAGEQLKRGYKEAAETLRRIEAALLAQKQEPVAWIAEGQGWVRVFLSKEAAGKIPEKDGILKPLYVAPPAPAVTVKALEWVDRGEMIVDRYKATSVVGDYYVSKQNSGSFSWRLPSLRGSVVAGTAEQAKVAAQADYERRILSAITIQPQNEEEKSSARS